MESMCFFDTFTIGYITKGSAKFLFPDHTVIYANEGDAIYIPYTTLYMSTWIGTPDIEFYSLQYKFSSPWDIMYQFKVIQYFPEESFATFLDAYEKDDDYVRSMRCFYSLLEHIFSNLKKVIPSHQYYEIKNAVDYIEKTLQIKSALNILQNYVIFLSPDFIRFLSLLLVIRRLNTKTICLRTMQSICCARQTIPLKPSVKNLAFAIPGISDVL